MPKSNRISLTTLCRYYHDTSWQVLLHICIRYLTCPFKKMLTFAPTAGDILELGCGHGVFCTLLAVTDSKRKVIGIDIDSAKIAAAESVARSIQGNGSHVSFYCVQPGQLPEGLFDAIFVVDVLYLMDESTQYNTLGQLLGKLKPGGKLLVKEMATKPWIKFVWCKMQESLSVKTFKITAWQKQLPRFHFIPLEKMALWFKERGFTVQSVPLDKGYLHPHHLLVIEKI